MNLTHMCVVFLLEMVNYLMADIVELRRNVIYDAERCWMRKEQAV